MFFSESLETFVHYKPLIWTDISSRAAEGWSSLSAPPHLSPKAAHCYQWMTWAVDSILFELHVGKYCVHLSMNVQELSIRTAQYAEYACDTSTTHRRGGKTGMYACSTVCHQTVRAHKLQLWRLKISTGWVGLSCQRTTVSVGRWMMEEKRNGVEGLESICTHEHNGPILNERKTSAHRVVHLRASTVCASLYKRCSMSAFLLNPSPALLHST